MGDRVVIEFRRRRFWCWTVGHRWIQPEGIFTKSWCRRCGVLR